jgi:glycosyltransferase involved in cell wall biosynthesis
VSTAFKIIINCGACQDFIGRCLSSVRAQTCSRWDAYVTVDPCGDDTYARAVGAASGEPRIHVHANHARQYSIANLVDAIHRSDAASEDVIVALDGDDWFAGNDSLQTIADAYERLDCWLTYGSWLSVKLAPSGEPHGRWPAYPEGTVDFRSHPFLGTAVRTWKRWLWDHLRDDDLRDESGEYVRVSEDKFVMMPLLEMCGTARARHIAAPIMIYNKIVDYTVGDPFAQERVRNAALIARRQPYPRLIARTSTAPDRVAR